MKAFDSETHKVLIVTSFTRLPLEDYGQAAAFSRRILAPRRESSSEADGDMESKSSKMPEGTRSNDNSS